MTLLAVVGLAAGAALLRLTGMFAIGPLLDRRPFLRAVANLIPAAVVAAVIAQITLVSKGEITIDARLVGISVAGLLVWRRAPLIVVVIAAAASTALVRAIT